MAVILSFVKKVGTWKSLAEGQGVDDVADVVASDGEGEQIVYLHKVLQKYKEGMRTTCTNARACRPVGTIFPGQSGSSLKQCGCNARRRRRRLSNLLLC